jgi:hypothetical protein
MDAEQTPVDPNVLPLPADGPHSTGAWLNRIKASKGALQPTIAQGRENTARYQVKHYSRESGEVVVPKDFSNVEQKKAQLFFQSPEVQLRPTMPGLETAALQFQAVVNEKLGPDGTDALSMVGEAIFDVLCPAGFAATKIGYESTTQMVNVPTMSPEAAAAGGIPPDMIPTAQAPRVIHSRYFWERFSPGMFLFPSDFKGSNFDDAPWLGMAFSIDAETGRKKYGLNTEEGSESKTNEDERLMTDPSQQTGERSTTPKLTGYEIWYKASLFDANEVNPERIRELVFIDGVDRPVVNRDSPYQKFDEFGRFAVGMKGFPIHVLTIRYVSDQAIPPSDCTISRVLVDEESKFRTQVVQNRDRSMPQRWMNTQRVGPEFAKALQADPRVGLQAVIPVDGVGDEIVGEVARSPYPRENFTAVDYISHDIDEAWALGSNQRGVQADTGQTATEASIIQGNTDVRLDYERNRVLKWYTKGAEKFASLIQLFADEPEYISILGPNGAKTLQKWDKTTIAGSFVFTAKPDSAIRVDAASERRQYMDLYRVTANDPNVRRTELLKGIFQRFGLDPDRIIAEQLPEKGPEPPKITLSVSGMDLNPLAPQYGAVLALLAANGIQIDPAAALAAGQKPETGHGGMAEMEQGIGLAANQRTGQLQGNAEAQSRGLQ